MTLAGLVDTLEVALEYVANWLAGRGAVAIHNLMEDAATAEISRSLVWQWRVAGVQLDNGWRVTGAVVTQLLDEATSRLSTGWPGSFEDLAAARNLLHDLCTTTPSSIS